MCIVAILEKSNVAILEKSNQTVGSGSLDEDRHVVWVLPILFPIHSWRPCLASDIASDIVPQVEIVPLVSLNIQELISQYSEEQGQAAVTIRPRRPASAEQLITLQMTVSMEPVAPDAEMVDAF